MDPPYDALMFYRRTYGDLSPYADPEVAARLRKARKLKAQEIRIFKAQDEKCFLCGEPMILEEVTKDHVWPRSKGGTLPHNVLLAHSDCNVAKGDRAPYPCELVYLKYIWQRIMERVDPPG